MDHEANRATAVRLINRLADGIIDEEVVTEDATWWVPGRGVFTKTEFAEIARMFRSLLKDGIKMTIHGITAEGDRVAVEAETYGEMKNGKIYNNSYHFLFLFRDGKIYHAKEYNDSLHAAEIIGGAL